MKYIFSVLGFFIIATVTDFMCATDEGREKILADENQMTKEKDNKTINSAENSKKAKADQF